MTSENIGASEDLELTDDDADKVVGGSRKRRRAHKTNVAAETDIMVSAPASPAPPGAVAADPPEDPADDC